MKHTASLLALMTVSGLAHALSGQVTDASGKPISGVAELETAQDQDHHEEEHDADHHDKYHEAHGHSDIEAYYRYRCEQPDELRSLTTTISIEFPDTRSLQVQWIVNGRQGAITLENGQRHIIFR